VGIARKAYDFANRYRLLNLLSDKVHITLKYRLKMGHRLDWKTPKSFTEKLNWLKLYDHDPRYIPLVDKWDVMDFVRERIGDGYCVQKFGIWDSFEAIDFDRLPNQFVLKCTNDSGGIVICKDKALLDREAARAVLNRSLKRNYYWHNREWPYKGLKPRILAEEFLEDASGNGLIDYKFFCFDGKPKLMFIATGRAEGKTCFDFFDMEFNWIPVKQHYPNAKQRPEKPECFDEMIMLAQKLAKDLKHVRVDFFQVDGKVYFGELTFTHFGGYERFEPEAYDGEFGEFLNLN